MAGGGVGGSYSKKIGCVYIFNLVCGVGALMLPLAFNKAGLILGLLFLAFCSFLAFICVTYVIEVMSCSNYLLRRKEQKERLSSGEISINQLMEEEEQTPSSPTTNSPSLWIKLKSKFFTPDTPVTEHSPLINGSRKSASRDNQSVSSDNEELITNDHDGLLVSNESSHSSSSHLLKDSTAGDTAPNNDAQLKLFSIVTQTELGLCAEQFLGPFGKVIFYLVIIFYLYGDLAIYAVSVPKSVYQVTGAIGPLSDTNTFRVYALIFAIFIVPICYLNFSKTKYLQLFTLAMRNLALALMIILSLVFIIQGNGASWKDLRWFDLSGIETLYGVTIYSFMCHHSLPGIVSPIKDKRKLNLLFLVDFLSIFSCYILLCYTAMFAFGHQKYEKCPAHIGPDHPCQIQELFTYNFTSYNWAPVGYFLALFPVFTLSSNFPLIAITLRGNIQTLFKDVAFVNRMHWLVKRLIFSSIATLPPIVLVFFTQDITKLASLTGGFAGLGIQFFFPALMVFFARRRMMREFRSFHVKNPHGSWFKSFAWIELVLGFASIGLVYQIILQCLSFYRWVM